MNATDIETDETLYCDECGIPMNLEEIQKAVEEGYAPLCWACFIAHDTD